MAEYGTLAKPEGLETGMYLGMIEGEGQNE